MVMVSLTHCQKAPLSPFQAPSESPSGVLMGGGAAKKPPLVIRKARAVVYKVTRKSPNNKQTNIGFGQGILSITLKPEDFKSSEVSCSQDDCTATLIEPITVNASIPTGLGARIKVQYRKARMSDEELFSHYGVIGGQWTLLKVGEIISLTIEAGIAFESTPATNYQPVFKEVYCSKSLSCDTPLVTINGTIDKNGLQFDSRLTATGQEGDFLKVVSNLISHNQKIPFDQIKNTQWLEKLPSPPSSPSSNKGPCHDQKSYDALSAG